MHFKALPIALVTLSFANIAAADGLTFGHVNLEYVDGQLPSSNPNATVLEGAVEYELNQFLFSADVRYQRFNGFMGNDYGVTAFELGAGYQITPQVLFGGGIVGTNSDFGDTNGYQIFGQYDDDVLGVAFNVEQANADNALRHNAVMGQYAINQDISAGAHVSWFSNWINDDYTYRLNLEYEAGPFDLRGHYTGFSDTNAGILGARGYYYFTDEIRGYASYQASLGSDSGDTRYYLIGGGYRLADQIWIDGAYGQTLGDAFFLSDFERLTLTISFDTGTRQRLDDTFEQDIINDRQDGTGLFPT